MPVKRDYNVKGSNDFLILAAIFFFLCLWAIKDAWFPSDKVIKKHPQVATVTCEISGAVEEVNVGVGDTIGEDQVLATLRNDRNKVLYEEAKDTYTVTKKKHAMLEQALKNMQNNGATSDGIAEVQDSLDAAASSMQEALNTVEDLKAKLDASHLKAPSKGQIMEVKIVPHTSVEEGQEAFVINPKDHFYLFNKSLTVLSALLFCVFLGIHFLGR